MVKRNTRKQNIGKIEIIAIIENIKLIPNTTKKSHHSKHTSAENQTHKQAT